MSHQIEIHQCTPLKRDSLVGRIYKARYFPNYSFLEAELGGNLSFIWRSFFESQKLIKDGSRRRIGHGSSTEVLNTPWLLSEANPCVVSTHPALTNCRVSQLMKPDSRQLDMEIIDDLFDSRDVELIKQVPLSVNLGDDTWFGNKDPTGFFTVKSSYKHLQLANGSWNSSMEDDVWKVLWKIKAPPKVLHFSWKALSGCLPTRTQLHSRHVLVDLHCVLCNYGEESIFHVLVQCSFAHSCWIRSALGVGHSTTTNFFDWFMEVLAVGNMGLVEETVMIG
ncbi:uncharacterized protein LOC133033866 [Cannabis sativa]|uniref:uncharacterized protein LOC133033866 n=1 Tax=Cannabis sativa TaxID=3483 RepID=UPI0029CA9E99|nr:uncharacterized protein LOC133033866 [Cannabis sativa]